MSCCRSSFLDFGHGSLRFPRSLDDGCSEQEASPLRSSAGSPPRSKGESDVKQHGLSYVGEAVETALRRKHWPHYGESWHITHGKIVGDVAQTPHKEYWGAAEITPAESHSDSFPERMCDIITRAQDWVDISSLSPPDGKFLSRFAWAIKDLARNATRRGKKVTVRLVFGNIIGMPVDCDAVRDALTKHVPQDSNIEIWVGAWRKRITWNHSKIIAVDGQYIFQGGHNLWDDHYLKKDPVHDISMEASGVVSIDGHIFLNAMWKFIIETDRTLWISNKLPDWMPWLIGPKVGVSQWPKTANFYPPMYHRAAHPLPLDQALQQGEIPMITCGRYGALHKVSYTANPADSAITAMLASSRTSVRMSLQDFGPLTLPIPGCNTSIPGGVWPREYLRALGLAIYKRGVDVEIILSNPHAVPGGLSPLTANYGNGWSCVDVAAEIIKAIQREVPDLAIEKLRHMVRENLRISYLKSNSRYGGSWPDGGVLGNHAKFFIVDDTCYYLGSQNLYIADLAEWGIIVDSKVETQKILKDYWMPMWAQSYSPEDCDVDDVMDALDIERDGVAEAEASAEEKSLARLAMRRNRNIAHDSLHHVDDPAEHDMEEEDDQVHFEVVAPRFVHGYCAR